MNLLTDFCVFIDIRIMGNNQNMIGDMKDEIKEVFTYLSMSAGKLTPGQLEFAISLHRYYSRHKMLSEKQKKVLFSIKNSLSEITFSKEKTF